MRHVALQGRRITDAVITNGFLAMVDAAIKTGKCSETVKFVENYPSVMNISPTRVALYAPRLVSYVAEVLEKSVPCFRMESRKSLKIMLPWRWC